MNLLYTFYLIHSICVHWHRSFSLSPLRKTLGPSIISMPINPRMWLIVVPKSLLCSVYIFFSVSLTFPEWSNPFTLSSSSGSVFFMIPSIGRVFHWAFYLDNWVNIIVSSWLFFSNYISLLNSIFVSEVDFFPSFGSALVLLAFTDAIFELFEHSYNHPFEFLIQELQWHIWLL